MKWRESKLKAIVRGKPRSCTTWARDRNTRRPTRTLPDEIILVPDPLHAANEEGGDILPGGIDHLVSHDSEALRQRARPRRPYYGSKIFVADLVDLGNDLVEEPIGLINEKRLLHTEFPSDHEDKRRNRWMTSE